MFVSGRWAAAAAAACWVFAGSALAQSNNSNAANSDAASRAQHTVDASATAIQQMQSNSEFQNLLKQAKGIFIVPELAKGAVVVGGSGGTGALLVHNNGRWTDPAFFTIGSISIGAQAGGKAGPVTFFLMTDKAVAAFTQHNNFSFNGNAGLTIVNWSPTAQGSVGKGDIVVWSGESGLFAGLSISGSDIVADTAEDQAYYKNDQVGTKQIIDNQIHNAQAEKLVTKLPS